MRHKTVIEYLRKLASSLTDLQVTVETRESNAEETAARELKMNALFGVLDDD